MQTIIGLKELRTKLGYFAGMINRGKSFVVVRKSKPLFKIVPIDEEAQWEDVADFTKIKKGGINIKEALKYI